MPNALPTLTPARLVLAAVCLLLALAAAMLVLGSPAVAKQPSLVASLSSRVEASPGHGRRRHRRAGAIQRRIGMAQAQVAERPAAPGAAPDLPLLEAGFENGLANWNIAGVGEVVPTVVDSAARSGVRAGRVVLSGSESRSELILGGDGTSSDSGTIQFEEGDEFWYGFSFDVKSMVWGHPGAHNVITQLKSDGTGSPNFALQLWDYAGDPGEVGGRGLWVYSEATGDTFAAPADEQRWHDVAVHFRASSHGAGFFEVYLDGLPVASQGDVSTIVPGHSYAYLKTGLYRNGAAIQGTSEVLFDSAKLGTSAASVAAG